MADLLLIKAVKGAAGELTWEFVDEGMVGYAIQLDRPLKPEMMVQVGDVWQAEILERVMTPRNRRRVVLHLIVREREVQPFEQITELPDFWMPPKRFRAVLVLLSQGRHAILIGPKGTGKTTFCYRLAEAMGWQVPCKVEIAAVRHAAQLFGSDSALNGSTSFQESYLLEYIERARVAHEQGLKSMFLVVLDEWNRVHAQVKAPLHGALDETRQLTIPTEGGSRTIFIPPNVVFVATVNIGFGYGGTHALDEADMSRFFPTRMRPMPEDYEVKLLAGRTGLMESQALRIVRVANALRQAAKAGLISYGPSFREVMNAGLLVMGGLDTRWSVTAAMLSYLDGERDDDEGSNEPNSEYAKGLEALTQGGISS